MPENIYLKIAGYEMRGIDTVSGDSFSIFPPKNGTPVLNEYAVEGPGLTKVLWTDQNGNTRYGVVDLVKK